MAKKRMVNREVKDTAADILLNNPSLTAKDLKKEVEKSLKEKGYNYHFTERTYLNIRNELLPNIGDKPIDKPWSIGACEKYNIPSDFIPILIQIQQARELMIQQFHIQLGQISIRQAKWFVRLYPSVQSLVEKHHKVVGFAIYRLLLVATKEDVKHHEIINQINKEAAVFILLIILVRYYALKEHISEITKEDSPDTSELDSRYFIREDISETSLFDAIFVSRLTASEILKSEGFSLEGLKELFGTQITQNLVDVFNEGLRAGNSGNISEWIKKYGYEIDEMLKLREAKQNERLNNPAKRQ